MIAPIAISTVHGKNLAVMLASIREYCPEIPVYLRGPASVLDRFDADVRISQARRWVVYEALREGGYYPWDYQPLQKASERYMRNHMDLNVVEENARYPRGE